jgi:hypothetical protein
MVTEEHQASLVELLAQLITDIPNLLTKEVQLAKVEIAVALNGFLSAAATLAIGSVLAIGATGVLIAAIVNALAAFLVYQGIDAALADTISASLVGVVIAVAAWWLIWRALAAMRTAAQHLQRTAGGVAADVALVSESLR